MSEEAAQPPRFYHHRHAGIPIRAIAPDDRRTATVQSGFGIDVPNIQDAYLATKPLLALASQRHHARTLPRCLVTSCTRFVTRDMHCRGSPSYSFP